MIVFLKIQTTGIRCKVGCTAVALGQILNYWNCKVFPDGSQTYTPANFPYQLTVDFYNQDYDWDDMNTVPAVTAEFLYHCGVAIEVNYTDSSTWISYGHNYKVRDAMEDFFGFQTSGLESKNSYSPSTWINMLKADINAGRPIYYTGIDTFETPDVAHAWVIDGYKANNTFHCNWGWNGNYSGEEDWFYLTDLSPGSHNYTQNQYAILGAEPILDACSGLDGADIICSSNESYSVSIPSTASVVWSKSSSLNEVGGHTSPTYTVSPATSGSSGYVSATIKNSQEDTFLVRHKEFWIGSLDENKIVYSRQGQASGAWAQYHLLCHEGSTYAVAGYDFDGDGFNIGDEQSLANQSILEYDWDVPAGWSWNTTYGGGVDNEEVEISPNWGTNPSPGDMVQIGVRVRNGCGWTNWEYNNWAVINCDGGGLLLSFSPNPATGETTLTIESGTETQTLKSTSVGEDTFDDNAEWDIEIYSPMQALKTKKTKLKGKSTTIQTAGWKEGVYMVRVNYKDEILTGKLIVKR